MNFQSRDSHSSSLFRSDHILKLEDKILLENILFVNKSSEPISDLGNLSINSEKFPDSCKAAKLRPLYKKGSLTQLCNFRPISLLPRKSNSRSNKYISEFKTIIMHLPIWFSRKAFYRFLPFLSE